MNQPGPGTVNGEGERHTQRGSGDDIGAASAEQHAINFLMVRYRDAIKPDEMRSLLRMAADVSQGRPLSAEKLARISAIRARLARAYHRG